MLVLQPHGCVVLKLVCSDAVVLQLTLNHVPFIIKCPSLSLCTTVLLLFYNLCTVIHYGCVENNNRVDIMTSTASFCSVIL